MQACGRLVWSFTVVFELMSLLTLLNLKPVQSLSPPTLCRSLCGGIPINYPFGVDDGCGAPHYRKMMNCSGDLFLITPSGSYKVRSIDYDKQTMVIFDPAMSTCTTLQPHHDFIMTEIQSVVMPPSSDTVFALLNCSIDSPVLNHYSNLCFNFSGHSCDELYSACTSFRIFQQFHSLSPPSPVTITPNPFLSNLSSPPPPSSSISLNPPPPCCFTGYDTVKLMSMNILDCTHYTTVYDTDNLKGVGPLDWSYGMKLTYTVPNVGCDRCQNTGGTCGFDTETEGMLCICSTSSNSTRDCGNALGGGNMSAGGNWGPKQTPLTIFQLLILAFGALFNMNLWHVYVV
ncbi:uncharacterized protein LOC122090706 isoform X2 [Macadamia integrifolia]|uniref:uncharacterized protein LOC122090706 isoform X2 n=1 Tax=Macadamia integrifolia TaxID=60698 RepID=UPI001C4F7A5A|nr:uncharacterized protein LOC122090706 isoform X2 [Macadamia integrifolia]